MAVPIAALIAAGASLGGSIMNYTSQEKNNAKTRAHTLDMYNRQRDDNIRMWQMQNAYNDPSQQMARLKGAGLNPHLVYGKGADATAGPIAGASAQAWNPTAPQLDVNGPINSYFDTELKTAQTDNLRVMNTVHATEALIKSEELKSKARDNKIYDGLTENTTALALEQLRKARLENDATADSNRRQNEIHPLNMQNALEQAMNSRAGRELSVQQRANLEAQLRDTQVQTLLREAELKLRRQGINPNGPLWERVLGNIIDEATKGKSIYSVLKQMLF